MTVEVPLLFHSASTICVPVPSGTLSTMVSGLRPDVMTALLSQPIPPSAWRSPTFRSSARLREDFAADGLIWITALRATSIQKLAADGALQPSLFDTNDLAEITHPGYTDERLIACFNPLLPERRARKRDELLAATEKELEKIAAAARRQKRPLRGRHTIALRAGRVIRAD